MKRRIALFLSLSLLFPAIALAASSSEPAPLLPESLSARSEIAASQKTLTIFLKEKEPGSAGVVFIHTAAPKEFSIAASGTIFGSRTRFA